MALDGCTGVGDEMQEEKVAVPVEGDFTVCGMCGELMVFDKNLLLQKPSEDQMRKLKENDEMFTLLTRVQTVRLNVILRKMLKNGKNKT